MAKIEAVDAGVGEAIMLNEHGNIAECTGDNLFIVKDSRLITPPVNAGILEGITRNVVLRLAERLGIQTAESDVTPEDLYAAQECFLTGTAAEVIAVTRVDGKAIGDGKVGPITHKLMDAFGECIRYVNPESSPVSTIPKPLRCSPSDPSPLINSPAGPPEGARAATIGKRNSNNPWTSRYIIAAPSVGSPAIAAR